MKILLTFAVLVLCSLTTTNLKAGPVSFLISDDSLKVQLVRDWERAKAYTKAYLDAMPEDGVSFKPTPEIRSFAEQMLHMSNASIFFVSTGTGKAKIYDGKNLEKLDEYKTKAALTKVVMEVYDYVIEAVKGLDATKLSEPVAMGPNKFSRYTWIEKGFEHQTHHRAQCTIYLRLKGATPPGEMLF
ncbi:MAG: DinB family protein [Chitinophagaceae bacterium]